MRWLAANLTPTGAWLFGQGIRGINVKKGYKTLAPAALVTGDGRPSPDRLGREIAREIQRQAQLQMQIVEVEREPDLAPTPCQATERKRHEVLPLNGIGAALAAVLSRAVRTSNRAVEQPRVPTGLTFPMVALVGGLDA